MSSFPFEHISLLSLVDQEPTAAAVLHQLGMPFYQYPHKTLAELCKERGWPVERVVRRMENAVQQGGLWYLDIWGRLQQGLPHSAAGLYEYPIEAVLAYLKHSHILFIRQQLPFMLDLISNIEEGHFDNYELAKDLKFVFPLFVDDFIHHIHEEEDVVFAHIEKLGQLLSQEGKPTLAPLFYHLNTQSIEAFATEHLEDDDEMQGIRQLTNNYEVSGSSSPYTKVIYKALQGFEEILSVHAKVENDILLPRAQQLEEKACSLIKRVSILN